MSRYMGMGCKGTVCTGMGYMTVCMETEYTATVCRVIDCTEKAYKEMGCTVKECMVMDYSK